NHEPSVQYMLSGRAGSPNLAVPMNQRKRSDFPNIGSVVSYFREPGDLPAAATIPRPIGHSGVTYTRTYAGFLGPKHDPLEREAASDTGQSVNHPLAGFPELPPARLKERNELLERIESCESANPTRKNGSDGIQLYREQALRMITSTAAQQAFDLSR